MGGSAQPRSCSSGYGNVVFTRLPYPGVMRKALIMSRIWSASLVLETMAARAGCAMACPFTSSADFEAAIIRVQLAKAAARRKRGFALAVVSALLLLAALVWLL